MAQALLPLSLLHKMPAPGLPPKEDRSPVSHLLPAFPRFAVGRRQEEQGDLQHSDRMQSWKSGLN